ncbi:hypothetical protein [Chitinophaga solisilvae]|uniref:hypothetical protein n=1 Tax=Chitinophaga solisilvae TaxID=1233460 RepID=UPI0013715F83|nr:hypothetical protein [Chitinophaga solisilvae]
MKKLLLMAAVVLSCLYACRKNDGASPDSGNPPVTTPVLPDPQDPGAMTKAVKVAHGKLVKGEYPTGSGASAPMLKEDEYLAVPSVAGGQYIIVPLITHTAAAVKGAYVKIAGADSYFEIDFSAPYNARKSGQPYLSASGNATGVVADSAICIRLPEQIKPALLTIEFAARYKDDKISNKVVAGFNIIK